MKGKSRLLGWNNSNEDSQTELPKTGQNSGRGEEKQKVSQPTELPLHHQWGGAKKKGGSDEAFLQKVLALRVGSNKA